MKEFIRRALRKSEKLTREQLQMLLATTANEVTRLETALNSIDSGLIVCDTRNRLLLKNRSADRLLNVKEHEASRIIWTLIEDNEVSGFLQTTLQNRDKAEDKEFTVIKNGAEKRLSMSVLPLVEERHVTGSLVIIYDITERREREAFMRRIETLASLTTLAAGVAHEIKNPLGSISIHIQLAKKAISRSMEKCLAMHSLDPDNPTPNFAYSSLEKYLSVVTDEIERLNKIVADFLFTLRPMKLEMKLGNINSLLKDVLDFYHFELEAANIKTEIALSDNLPPILFDSEAMKRAVLNLFKNAKEAMEKGGVLKIKTEIQDGKVKVSIEDTGCGIPDEALGKIFEPYWTTKPSGSGLGLILVFKIISEHGGEIAVHSRLEQGTRFDIAFQPPPKDPPQLTFTKT